MYVLMKSFLHPLIKSSKRIMEHLTVSLAYTISIYLLLFSTLISCLELSQVPKLYLDFVFPDINITNKWAKWLVLNYGCAVLIILAALLFFNDARDYFKIVFLSITLIVFYQYTVRTAGKDGADQLRMISFLTFTLCFLVEKEKGELLSISTVGFQVLVAYATSGVAKITSSHWRKGNLLADIFGTCSYGTPNVSSFLRKRPILERYVSYLAIASMLSVPVCFLLPSQGLLIASLACIFGFHFSTALLMGLNDFLLTFPLTYPGVLYMHGLVHGYITTL